MIDQRLNVQASFDQNFCHALSFHLTEALMNACTDKFNCLWCDGILAPEVYEQFTSRNITSIKFLVTRAWIGVRGNTPLYVMKIKVGRCSRRRALKGLDLDDCLPDADTFDWIEIDVENREIALQLK